MGRADWDGQPVEDREGFGALHPQFWRLQLKKVKGRHLYTITYMNMTNSGLQCEVAYLPAMTLGGTAQVAAAHCPNERTLDPAVCSYNRPTYARASYPDQLSRVLPSRISKV